MRRRMGASRASPAAGAACGPPYPAPRLGGLAAGAAARLGTGYAVEPIGAAPAPSTRGVWHVHLLHRSPKTTIREKNGCGIIAYPPHNSALGGHFTRSAGRDNYPQRRGTRPSDVASALGDVLRHAPCVMVHALRSRRSMLLYKRLSSEHNAYGETCRLAARAGCLQGCVGVRETPQ